MKKALCLLVLFVCLLSTSCKKEKKVPLISVDKYDKNAILMLAMCQKLANEPDAAKLGKAAWSVEKARVVACVGVDNECHLYGKFLSRAITMTKDNEISGVDRKELLERYNELKLAFESGRKKLVASKETIDSE